MDAIPFSSLIKKKFSEKNIILSADFFYAIATQKSMQLGSDLDISLLSRVNEINFRVAAVQQVLYGKSRLSSGSLSSEQQRDVLFDILACSASQLAVVWK